MRLRHLRWHHALLSSAVSVACSILLAPPAIAQSFFQKLLGFDSAPPAAVARPQARTMPAYKFRNRAVPRPAPRDEGAEGDEDIIGPPDSGGPYRTMCVRACDGFYFPLRHNARRRNFAQDAKSCRAACGEEARLFYYPVQAGSVQTMVDLAGRPYKSLPTAFGYRKALVNGCSCKPAPWTYEAAARHRSYAEEEKELLAYAREQALRRYTATVGPDAARQTLAVIDLDALPPEPAIESPVHQDQVAATAQAFIATRDGDPPAGAEQAVPAAEEAGVQVVKPRPKRKRGVRARTQYVTTSARAFPAARFYRAARQ